MLHEHVEREFAGNNKERLPRAPPKAIFDPAPDPMLSMQLQLSGRLSEYFPSISYSQQRDLVQGQRSVQVNEYHCDSNGSLSSLIQSSTSNVNEDSQVPELRKLTQRMNTAAAEVDFSYMERKMEGSYHLGVPNTGHSHGAHGLNLESNFSQGSKVFQSEVNDCQPDALVIYHDQLPPLESPPSTMNNATCSTPVQACKVNISNYPDLALQQFDCQPYYTEGNLTDVIRLQGPAPVLGRWPSRELGVNRKDLSMLNNALGALEHQPSQLHPQGSDSVRQSSRDVSAAVWAEASKYLEDMKQEQNQQQQVYDQQQAFLNFLRFSNAPHGVNKYCRTAPGDVENLQVRGRFSGDGQELLARLDGHGRDSHSTPRVEHNEVVAARNISCSVPASQVCSGVSIFQSDIDSMSKYKYTDKPASELAGIYSKSVPNSSLSSEKNGEFTNSPRLSAEPAQKTVEAFTPPPQDHSGLDLECNYNTTAQHSVSSQLNSLQTVEPRMKQVFRTEKQRRDFIKERYKTLQSLVPRYSKTDRASIVGDTIRYIHVLQQEMKELTLKKEQRQESLRKKTERSQPTRECPKLKMKIFERTFSDFCNSEERELRLVSKHGAVVRFQLITDELHVNLVQKHKPYFLNRLLISLSGFDLVNTSGGVIKNYQVLHLKFKVKGNLRETSVEMMATIMETLDQVV